MAIGEIDGEAALLVLHHGEDGWKPAHPVRIEAVGGIINRITDYYACPWIMPAAGSAVVSGRPNR